MTASFSFSWNAVIASRSSCVWMYGSLAMSLSAFASSSMNGSMSLTAPPNAMASCARTCALNSSCSFLILIASALICAGDLPQRSYISSS